jgi:hypothetical protein
MLRTSLPEGIPSVNALYNVVKRACKRAGITRTSRHAMRHLSAIVQAMAGIPTTQIAAESLGNDPLVAAKVYARFIPPMPRGKRVETRLMPSTPEPSTRPSPATPPS